MIPMRICIDFDQISLNYFCYAQKNNEKNQIPVRFLAKHAGYVVTVRKHIGYGSCEWNLSEIGRVVIENDQKQEMFFLS